MSTSPELKACPFCNGKAAPNTVTFSDRMVREQELPQATMHSVNCTSCCADIRGSMNGWATPDEAAAQWNRRASLSERDAPKNWRDNAKIMEEFRAIRLDLTMSDENDLAHLLDAVLQLGDAAPPRDTERLDFMEQMAMKGRYVRWFGKELLAFDISMTDGFASLREALDAARNSKREAPRTP